MYDLYFTEEQQQLRKTARDFARSKIVPVAGQLDEEGHFPVELLKEAWSLGLMNCEVPEEFGGLGLSCLSHCMIQEEIAWACAGVNTSVAANALAALPVIIAGTREQKEKYQSSLLTAVQSPTLARMSRDCAPTSSKTATVTS